MVSPTRTALITGVAGQDGVYLSRLLRADGYRVVGTLMPHKEPGCRMAPYLEDVELHTLDVRDGEGFATLLAESRPDEIYNLAAFTSVGASWKNAEMVGETNGMAVLKMLESIVAYREAHGLEPRYYQASTSEMFGLADQHPQTATTPHFPRSPYAAAKSFAHNLCGVYRESYGLFAASGILYNHESPLRGMQFVTRKITRGVAEIALGQRDKLTLGNLDVRRDWGAVADYVRSMALTLRQDHPSDFVIATGVSHSLGELLEVAFDAAGLGSPASYVEQDPALMRPADVPETLGDATKAREQLGWEPTISFQDMVGQMVRVDMQRLASGVEESPDYL